MSVTYSSYTILQLFIVSVVVILLTNTPGATMLVARKVQMAVSSTRDQL